MYFDCREPDDECSGADKPVVIQNLFSHVINDQGRAFSEPINYNSFLYIFWRARVCWPLFAYVAHFSRIQYLKKMPLYKSLMKKHLPAGNEFGQESNKHCNKVS